MPLPPPIFRPPSAALSVDAGFKLGPEVTGPNRSDGPSRSGRSGRSDTSSPASRIYYEGRLDGSRHDFDRFQRSTDFAAARQQLIDTLNAIIDAVGRLPMRDSPTARDALIRLKQDIDERDGRLAQSGYLPQMYGSSKRDLERIAVLLRDDRLPAEQRAAHMEDMVDGLIYCATRVVQVIRDAHHALACAGGGLGAQAAQTLAELQRACLTDFVRRQVERDLRDRRDPAAYEVHHVVRLARRVGLARMEGMAADSYLSDSSCSDEMVEACRAELAERVTPVRVARVLASQALEGIRHELDEVLHGAPLDLSQDAHRALFSQIKQPWELKLGPMPDQALVDIDVMSGATRGLHRDTTLLTAAVLGQLEQAGILDPAHPLRLVGWHDEEGAQELLSLRPGLALVRSPGQWGFDAAPDWTALMRLEALETTRPLGTLPPSVLPADTREAIALSAIPQASDEALTALSPHWVASPDVAQVLLQRWGPEGLLSWIDRHPAARQAPVRDAIGVMAARERQPTVLNALDWAHQRPLEAYGSWLETDAHAHLHAALSRGDQAMAAPWTELLIRASPLFSRDDLLAAQLGKDPSGQPLQLVAMASGDVAQTRARTQFFLTLFQRGVLSESMLVRAIMGADLMAQVSETGVSQALAHGHSAVIQAYGEAVSMAVRTGVGRENLLEMFDDHVSLPGGESRSSLATAIANGHEEAVRAWLLEILNASHQRLLNDRLLFHGLASGNSQGRLAAAEAVRQDPHANLAPYFNVVIEAYELGMLTDPRWVCLMNGSKHGHNQVLDVLMAQGSAEALSDYLGTVLNMAHRWGLTRTRLLPVLGAPNEAGLRPLDRAMEAGQTPLVKTYLDTLIEATQFGYLTPSDLRTLLASVSADKQPAAARALAHPDTLRAWLTSVLEVAGRGGLSSLEVRDLFKGRDAAQRGLLERAAAQAPSEALQVILDALLSATAKRLIRPRDLFELLTREDRAGRFPLRSAIVNHRAEQVTALGEAIRQAFVAGHFSAKQASQALSIGFRGAGSRFGRMLADAPRPAAEAVVKSYTQALIAAVKAGAMSADRAGRLLAPVFRSDTRPFAPYAVQMALREAVVQGALEDEDRVDIQISAKAVIHPAPMR